MWDNHGLSNRMKQCISESCSSRKRAGRHMLFELLGYDSLLNRNRKAGSSNSGKSGKEVALAQRRFLKMFPGSMNCTLCGRRLVQL